MSEEKTIHEVLAEGMPETAGMILRRWRTGLGLTLRETSRLADISIAYLSDLERGQRKLTESVAQRLVRALDMSDDDAAFLVLLSRGLHLPVLPRHWDLAPLLQRTWGVLSDDAARKIEAILREEG